MKKISTLYKKNPQNLSRVINQINPENEWVFKYGIPTRKFDGSACSIINGELYKRYDCKFDKYGYKKPIPIDAIPCQKPDPISGHHPHWIKCNRHDNNNKWHFIAFDNLKNKENGTYELCGPKINGNPENFNEHILIKHGSEILNIHDFSFESLKSFLSINDIEGIVFHNTENNKMCKIRKSDFGIIR